MQFKDVIGQAAVKHHLVDMVRLNRLSHALFFLGKEGSGALATALAFAQYVVCEKANGKFTAQAEPSLFAESAAALGRDVTVASSAHYVPGLDEQWLTDACGQCSACLKAKEYVHPDIHFSYPVIPKKTGEKPVSTDYIKEWREFVQLHPYGNAYDWLQFIDAENKQGNITAQECNEILRKLSLKSFESEFKILIMWMPEYLGNEGNKLLKIIEEPPLNTLFILVGENESLILSTILSRCQLVKIPAISLEAVETALVERCKLEPAQAKQIAGISAGNYREALQLMQNAEEDWQDLLREWLNATLKTGPLAQVKWVDEISKMGREKQKQFLRYFNHILSLSIRLSIMGEKNMLNVGGKEIDFMLRLNKLAGIAQQKAIVDELDKAAYYIERNANAKMLFHALTIKLYHIISDNALITPW